MSATSAVLALFAVVILLYFLYLIVKNEEAQRWTGVGLLVLLALDVWCVAVVFPSLPGVVFRIGYIDAWSITVLSAAIAMFVLACAKQLVDVRVIELLYSIFGPFTNALMLVFWSWLIPSLDFGSFWPNALLAGLVLHYLDIAVMRPLTRSFVRRIA